ncbi:hypothetical protein Tco_1305843 [Tanacetum coccineum]
MVDDDLKKPFKEALKMPLTRRIIKFAGLEYKMSANIKLYDGNADLEDHLSRFASAANSGEWHMPVWCGMFQQTLDTRKMDGGDWFHIRGSRSYEDLVVYGLAQVPRVCFEEAFDQTKLPKGETGESHQRIFPPAILRDDCPYRNTQGEKSEGMTIETTIGEGITTTHLEEETTCSLIPLREGIIRLELL